MEKDTLLILVKKRGTQMDRFYEMFMNNVEISLKEIKKLIARSTFHENLRREIIEINQTLEELKENVKPFEYSLIDKNGTTFKAIKRNAEMQIISTTNHFVLKIEREIKNG